MNKEEFNRLDIEQQRIYINSFLADGISITKACQTIGIDRATIRKRFEAKNIIFNKNSNRYIYNTSNNSSNNKSNTVKKDDITNINLDSIKLLEEKIKALESQIEATNHRIDTITNTKTTIDTENTINTINTTTKTTINTYEGEEVVRSFRINEEVQKRFKKYCKANSEHKVSDILSTILDNYLKSQDY